MCKNKNKQLCRILHFFPLYFSFLLHSQTSRGLVTILLKVTACLVFNVYFQRLSHPPVHFPTTLILHSECILVFSLSPSYMTQGNKTNNEANRFMDLPVRFVLLPASAARWQYVTGKPRASSRRRLPLLSTELGRAWASLRSKEGTSPWTRTWWEQLHSHRSLLKFSRHNCRAESHWKNSLWIQEEKQEASLLVAESVVKRKCILLLYKDSTAWN